MYTWHKYAQFIKIDSVLLANIGSVESPIESPMSVPFLSQAQTANMYFSLGLRPLIVTFSALFEGNLN